MKKVYTFCWDRADAGGKGLERRAAVKFRTFDTTRCYRVETGARPQGYAASPSSY